MSWIDRDLRGICSEGLVSATTPFEIGKWYGPYEPCSYASVPIIAASSANSFVIARFRAVAIAETMSRA